MVKTSGITTEADGSGSQGAVLTTEAGTGETGGIVWNGSEGTVYGSVTLQDDLTIGAGETLTIGDGASLTVSSGKTMTNNGTVTTTGNGTLTNNGKIDNSGTLPDNIQGSAPPKITTTSLPYGEVDKNYSQPLAATGNDTITWSSSDLPEWLTLDSNGTISGTPTAAGASTFTVTATNDSGSDSKAFTLTVTASTGPTTYTISTAEQLYAFANAVNTGNTTANAVLTADITLDSNSSEWTPIGKDDSHIYNGTFDGQGHTISGLHCSVTSGNVAGLFGVIGSSGVVKNVGIADSDVAVSTPGQLAYAGGVCGWSAGTVENCWNSGSVSASSSSSTAYAGGVCGWNQGGTIRNCWNSGSVNASSSNNDLYSGAYAGGVCGINYKVNDDNTAIQNCWNSGSVSANSSSSTAYAGGVCGDSTGSIETAIGSIPLVVPVSGAGRPTTDPDVESKTTDEFASGEVAWLLNQGQTGTPWARLQ